MSVATLKPEAAMGCIPDGARLVASPACGTPGTLLRGLSIAADANRRWTLFTGLLLGDQPFLDAVTEGHLRYLTSHVTASTREAVQRGVADLVPVRASQIGTMIRGWAERGPLVALVRLTPPDADGRASLGASTAYSRLALDLADVVIAELDETMPFTLGDTLVPADRVDCWVDSETPLPHYREVAPDPVSDRIADLVLELIPTRPVLQIGIGSVPEAIVRYLGDAGKGPLRFAGMVGDAVAALDDAGQLDVGVVPDPAVTGVDLMGTDVLWRWAHRNPRLGMYGSERGHSPAFLATLERLTSVNSAFEVDVAGQVNAEVVAGRQISGAGGSHDFVEAAITSVGGRSIIALPSTTRSGATRIVPSLDSATVTIPRTMVDTIVTEYGVARLRGATLRERAEALVAIAHPNHRDRLDAEIDRRLEHQERT